jgi:hypothetical protein
MATCRAVTIESLLLDVCRSHNWHVGVYTYSALGDVPVWCGRLSVFGGEAVRIVFPDIPSSSYPIPSSFLRSQYGYPV